MKPFLTELCARYHNLGSQLRREARYVLDTLQWHYYYRRYWRPAIRRFRSKSTPVNFVFVIYDLPTWKTEALYCDMLRHPRFSPVLAVTAHTKKPACLPQLTAYLEKKGYAYTLLDNKRTLAQQLPVDVVIYQRPYSEEQPLHRFQANRRLVTVYANYGLHIVFEEWLNTLLLWKSVWHDYYEGEAFADRARCARDHGKHIVVTGLPTLDQIRQPASCFADPWPARQGRKRIIWAPHYSVGSEHYEGLAYSNFLEMADAMLHLATRYADQACFAFKPHPMLYPTLLRVWGKERTDAYYDAWRNLPNGQLEEGEYIGLFKHSDALIHDCVTFLVEYLATGKPTLFVRRSEFTTSNLTRAALDAYLLHYIATDMQAVDAFVQQVLSGHDPQQRLRLQFISKELRAPHGRTACQNIMHAILGTEEYASCR